MPQYFTPGVYVEEIERGPRPIEGVPTSIAAFLGQTARGPLRPRLVTSFNDYKRYYGGLLGKGQYMPYAVSGFFENGGTQMYVCRIVGSKAIAASIDVGGNLTLQAIGPGKWGNNIWYGIAPGSTKIGVPGLAGGPPTGQATGFRLRLAYWTDPPADKDLYDPFEDFRKQPRPEWMEVYDDLSIDPKSADFFQKRLTDSTNSPISALASLVPTDPQKPIQMPPNTPLTGVLFKKGGDDGPVAISAADFEGKMDATITRTEVQGLEALLLDDFRDIAIAYAPYPNTDAKTVAAINQKIYVHCEDWKYRFAAIDCSLADDPGNINPRVDNQWDTEYAAFYAPWIQVSDPVTGAPIVAPPGGHVLGVYARTDTERGVYKAPANEIVRGALDVTKHINDAVQGTLNPRGVNVIRSFPGRGIRVWGARTLSSNALWKYVSVRRLFIFLERSIYEGTQWVVFEPNDDRLWARVKDTIRLFLRSQWRQGALFGRTEDEAFFITCDRTTMSQDDILNGRLICEIGIAPVRPAEFVVFRVFQQTAEAQK